MKHDIFDHEKEKHFVKQYNRYVVVPALPDKLKPLLDISYNLWWVWNSEALELFRRIDIELWDEVNHNPIQLLGAVSQKRLAALAEDDSFIAHLERIQNDQNNYLKASTWYSEEFPDNKDTKIAYFSTEFGIHDSLPLYSGGLGILSGDHLKSASDMGVPLIGVGLLYRFGYFKQYLNIDGWQQEEYIENHFFRMPLIRLKDENGSPLKVFIETPSGKIFIQVWKLQVGRVPLYMLDTDIPENKPEDREVTGQLYGGDREMRIRQEMVLGIGGMRALKALGIEPQVVHINEGHSAFLLLEKMRALIEENKFTYEQAQEITRSASVFTTHTPVPAGNEVFDPELVSKYLEPVYKKLGLKKEEFLALGRKNPEDLKEQFCMTILALKLSDKANGVSRLHGTISRSMWTELYPGLPKSEVPITHITNGIHASTWISRDIAGLFDRYIGPTWKDDPSDQSIWQRVSQIPDTELWRSHERRRERLVTFARNRLKKQLLNRGASPNEIERAEEVLDPEALTICFARRFASYKRGNLIFRDIARLKSIISKKNTPVQIIFAGKAHPHDNFGKELIKSIIHIARDPELRDKIVFLEDYDISVAHYMVQGADVWMNNPVRPLEASGTSGMKAAVNGALNFSVLDGWWCEAYDGKNGWIIGSGEEYDNPGYQDEIESKTIYDVLEQDIIPLYYERGHDGLPRNWINKMKTSMYTICPVFNTNRMIEEYTRTFYNSAGAQYQKTISNNHEYAKKIADWKKHITSIWDKIKIVGVEDNAKSDVILSKSFQVKAKILAGGIDPNNIGVQIFAGKIDSKNRMSETSLIDMNFVGTHDGYLVYEGTVNADKIGHCGYVVRVVPKFENKIIMIPKMITWQS